jgi:soluble lytic murein transglycosylase
MSTRSVSTRPRAGARSTRGRGARGRRQAARRRRLLLLGMVVAAAVAVPALLAPFADKAVQEVTLPLRHEDIIRQQAEDKALDPALIAGVIYAESRFRDQTSHAGAKGLMQIMPATADFIARKSGGTAFEQGDLATPQINIAYGSWYLRYLLRHYHGNVVLALAAYNAGEGMVDGWWEAAQASGERFRVSRHVPFPETRDYVARVLDARARYKREYRSELGLG